MPLRQCYRSLYFDYVCELCLSLVYAEDDDCPALIAAEDVSSSWCYSQSELLLSGEFVTRPACHDSGPATSCQKHIRDESNWLLWRDGLKPPDKLLNYGRFPCQKWWNDQFQRLNSGANSKPGWWSPMTTDADSKKRGHGPMRDAEARTLSVRRGNKESPDALAGKQNCTSDQFL